MKISRIKISLTTFHAVIIVAVLVFVANATSQAATLTYENITNNSLVQLSDQLSTDVNAVGTTGVEFTFKNNINIGVESSITDIYFDLGSNTNLFTALSISEQSSGVSFDLSPRPKNLPSGKNINFYSDFGGDSTSPRTSANGVNAASEYITFLATLGSGFSYKDAMAAIFEGSLRLGMHIQAIAGGGAEDSDSYVNVSKVPVPAAAWLFGTALFGFFVTTSRRKKTHK